MRYRGNKKDTARESTGPRWRHRVAVSERQGRPRTQSCRSKPSLTQKYQCIHSLCRKYVDRGKQVLRQTLCIAFCCPRRESLNGSWHQYFGAFGHGRSLRCTMSCGCAQSNTYKYGVITLSLGATHTPTHTWNAHPEAYLDAHPDAYPDACLDKLP